MLQPLLSSSRVSRLGLQLRGRGTTPASGMHPACIRIAFALNNIARGTDILLDPFIQLVSSSSKAQANVAEWATQHVPYRDAAKAALAEETRRKAAYWTSLEGGVGRK